MDTKYYEKLMRFLREEGILYGPSPEIYGGLSGFYSYGPLGMRIKKNIEKEILDLFNRFEFFEISAPIIMPSVVFEASGHLGNFTDPLVKCSKCKSVFRLDHIYEKELPTKKEELLELLNSLKCPNCNSNFEQNVENRNLMMKTNVGISDEAYLRPETATTTYLDFNNYLQFFRKKLPFSVIQIGKAFRNEISPRQGLLRCREFTQAEAQIFIFEDNKNDFELLDDTTLTKDYLNISIETCDKNDLIQKTTLQKLLNEKKLQNKAYACMLALSIKLIHNLGIPEDKIRIKQHKDSEKAFYALDAWDIELNLNSFGWVEVCGVHDRGNYDLTQHQKFSKTSFETFDEKTGSKKIPHIIEIAYGVDRLFFSKLDFSYSLMDEKQGKTTLKLKSSISPIKLAIFPLMKKDELKTIAKQIYLDLNKEIYSIYDETAPIGKRYLRANKKGIPYCITIDYDTIKDNTVTLRERDSEKQIRVKITELKTVLNDLLNEKIEFDSFKDKFIN